MTPARPPEPVQPPFSDRARASALAETVRLLDAGSHLGIAGKDRSAGVPADAAGSALGRTVTLLTTQAQALLAPGEKSPATPGAAPTESGQATPTPATSPASLAPSAARPSATAPSTAAPSTAAPSAAAPATASAAPLPSTAAGLVTALAHSGRQRLADAAMADGGMARLLAAVGTAQLLQASALAAATGTTAPAADVPAPQLSGTCPSGSAGAGEGATASPAAPASSATPDGADGSEAPGTSAATPSAATVGTALAAVARTEAQTIYGYQVALPRLDGDAAKSAAGQLAHHDALLRSAESLSELNCSAVPPREAGFTLSRSFLASPAAGLGNLEASALPVYGDLVALSGGDTRRWAIAALFDAGKRTVLWGADPGPLPGLDRAVLPPRPAG